MDLNAFNVDEPVFCTYDSLHENSSINNISFDSVITVEQEDVLNLISFREENMSNMPTMSWFGKEVLQGSEYFQF